MTLFTRTPLHVGAGSSVGAVDLPVVRERHTRFPVIPGSSLKGVLADLFPPAGENGGRSPDAEWLFGAEDAREAAAGALLVGEGRLLAFPVRSAKNAFAWITSPLVLARYKRDSGKEFTVPEVESDEECLAADALKPDEKHVVLEEYAFQVRGSVPDDVTACFTDLLPDDPVWSLVPDHIVILSDGMLSFFAENACIIANRIRIDDFTGTVASGALFNQENVPSETLFYAAISAQAGRGKYREKTPADALNTLEERIGQNKHMLQVGGDETTGLGWCTVVLR